MGEGIGEEGRDAIQHHIDAIVKIVKEQHPQATDLRPYLPQ